MGRYHIDMKSLALITLAMVAGLPSLAAAQQSPQPATPPAVYVPTHTERDKAKVAALGDLSDDHRAKVLAIVDRVNRGQLTDFHAAELQIDAVLTSEESRAVLAGHDKLVRTPNTDPTWHPGRFLLRIAITPEKLRELQLQLQQKQSNEP
jgi:hypothetical protein